MQTGKKTGKTVCLGGIDFAAEERDALLAELDRRLTAGEGTVVFTPNAAMAGEAADDPEKLALLREADIALPDGIGVVLAAARAGKKLRRLPGIEAGEHILRTAEREGRGVFFLGGGPGVAARAAARFPAVVGYRDGFFPEEAFPSVCGEIRASKAAAVFVCMGFPKQERFILRARAALPEVALWMGLGGSLDVWAGETTRAPLWMRACGLEWLWRCASDRTGEKWRRLPGMVRYVWKANCNNDG